MDNDEIREQLKIKDGQYSGVLDRSDKELRMFITDAKTDITCEVEIPFPYSASLSDYATDRVIDAFIIALQSIPSRISEDTLKGV